MKHRVRVKFYGSNISVLCHTFKELSVCVDTTLALSPERYRELEYELLSFYPCTQKWEVARTTSNYLTAAKWLMNQGA